MSCEREMIDGLIYSMSERADLDTIEYNTSLPEHK